jgi:hypothetical protein
MAMGIAISECRTKLSTYGFTIKVFVAPTSCMLLIKKRLAKMLSRVALCIKAMAIKIAITDAAPKTNCSLCTFAVMFSTQFRWYITSSISGSVRKCLDSLSINAIFGVFRFRVNFQTQGQGDIFCKRENFTVVFVRPFLSIPLQV